MDDADARNGSRKAKSSMADADASYSESASKSYQKTSMAVVTNSSQQPSLKLRFSFPTENSSQQKELQQKVIPTPLKNGSSNNIHSLSQKDLVTQNSFPSNRKNGLSNNSTQENLLLIPLENSFQQRDLVTPTHESYSTPLKKGLSTKVPYSSQQNVHETNINNSSRHSEEGISSNFFEENNYLQSLASPNSEHLKPGLKGIKEDWMGPPDSYSVENLSFKGKKRTRAQVSKLPESKSNKKIKADTNELDNFKVELGKGVFLNHVTQLMEGGEVQYIRTLGKDPQQCVTLFVDGPSRIILVGVIQITLLT